MKKCVRCNQEKQASEFSASKANKDGLHSWCIECNRRYHRKRRERLPREKKYTKRNRNNTEGKDIESFIDKKDECWIWVGPTRSDGYPLFYIDGVPVTPRRVIYQKYIGKIREGKLICVKCRNKLCVSPDHMYMS